MPRGPSKHVALEGHLAALPEDALKVAVGRLDEAGMIV
jgi:hypothetical protein